MTTATLEDEAADATTTTTTPPPQPRERGTLKHTLPRRPIFLIGLVIAVFVVVWLYKLVSLLMVDNVTGQIDMAIQNKDVFYEYILYS